MSLRNLVLAASLVATLVGCASQPPADEPERRKVLPDAYNTLSSRYVLVPGYDDLGVDVNRTSNWYYGAGQGLERYASGGTVYDEGYWQARYADMPDEVKAALDSEPLARFLFEFDSTELTPASQQEFASFLDGEALTGRVLVVGYTDDIGTEAYNGPLSQRRADAVASEIHNVWPEARVLTAGHGTYPKLVDDNTNAARAANRRAEIYYLETDQ